MIPARCQLHTPYLVLFLRLLTGDREISPLGFGLQSGRAARIELLFSRVGARLGITLT